MDKQMKKNIIIVAVILAVILVVVACTKMVVPKKFKMVQSSELVSCDGYIFFNDSENNICRGMIATGEYDVINSGNRVVAAYNDVIIADRGGLLQLIDYEGNIIGESYEVEADCVDFNDEYIYYKEKETGFIVRINRETKESETVINIPIDKFMIYKNSIVFVTEDRKMIYFYDLTTQIPMGYFGDKNIADFDIDDETLVYSDANNGYKVVKMDLSTGDETEIKTVRTKELEFKNGRIFYIENVKGKKSQYDIKVDESEVH